MKKLKILLGLSMIASLMWSCKKDETQVIASETGKPITFSISKTTFVLEKDKAEDVAGWFKSTTSNFGYDAYIVYHLQIDKKGNNFAQPQVIALTGKAGVDTVSATTTVGAFNDLAIALGLDFDVANDVEARVMAKISDSYAPVYSNVISLKITPYRKESWLNVAGDFQGWAPSSAPTVYAGDGQNHEGYIFFPSNKSTEFKLTTQKNWDGPNYGDAGSGKLSTNGGNITLPSTGFYFIEANPVKLTWKATKTDWGLIGSATPGGWDNSTPLVYNEAEGVWKASNVAITDGEFKFRANNGWDINVGNGGSGTKLVRNGGNITITPGTYDFVLDLRASDNLFYSFTKK